MVTLVGLLALGCGEQGGVGSTFPCTETGILDAVAKGGGPHTFDCSGPQTVALSGDIDVARDVILDGGGDLAIEARPAGSAFVVREAVTFEARNLEVEGGLKAVSNRGTTVLTNTTVSGVGCGGKVCIDGAIRNEPSAMMTLTNTIVSGSVVGIFNLGAMDLTNAIVSGNETAAIWNGGTMTMAQCTIMGSLWFASPFTDPGSATIANSLVDGECILEHEDEVGVITSDGNNIESPGDTCTFDHPTDQVGTGARAP